MSYRSQICIAVSKDVEIPQHVESALNACLEFYDKSNANYWCGDYIKWYSLTNPEVAQIERWLAELDEHKYGFLRLGEEGEEIKGQPFKYDIQSIRIITVCGSMLDDME